MTMLLALLACGDEDEQQDMADLAAEAPPAAVISAPVPLQPPAEGALTSSAIAESMNRFAFDLLGTQEGETVFSPASVAVAWGLLLLGARGETETAIATVFHQPDFEEGGVEQAYGQWLRELNEAEGPWTLRAANRVWAQQDLELQAAYEAGALAAFQAEVGRVDFSSPDAARGTINAWVAEQTEDRIPQLLGQGSIDGATRLVLTNAVYFLGSWEDPFEKDATVQGPFHAPTGELQVPMMRQTSWHGYHEAQGLQAVELPYRGDRLSAWVILHDQPLDHDSFATLAGSGQGRRVQLSLPRFELRTAQSLRAPLSDLGLGVAFSDQADLSGLTTGDLAVSDCIHEAWIKVDEEGTEAAAATGVVVSVTSMPPPPVEMTVDRPFTFVVLDKPTGAILFVARVENPAP